MLIGIAVAAAVAAEPPPACAFIDVTVSGTEDFAPIPNQTVVVVDGRIAAIGDVGDVAIPDDAVRVQGEDRFLAPGLTDAHVHLNDPDDLLQYMRHGVTTVVNMSGGPQHLAWRRAVEEGSLPGPHLFTTGPMIDEQTDPVFGIAVAVGSEAEAATVVAATADAGYDLIKVHGDLEVGLYDAVIEAADARELKVVGHLSERVGLLHATKMRQDSIEHADEYVHAFFNDRLDASRIPVAVEATAKSGARVTPTLVVMDAIEAQLTDPAALPTSAAGVSPLERAWWAPANNPYPKKYPATMLPWFTDSEAFQKGLVLALHRADVPLMVGTDTGWIPFLAPGAAVLDELDALADAGLPYVDALHAATDAPAAFLGTNGGSVAVGRAADLVLLPRDPRERRAYDTVDGVLVGGRWYDREALDLLAAEVSRRRLPSEPVAEALAGGDIDTAVQLARRALARGELTEGQAHVFALTLYRLGRFPDCLQVLAAAATAYPTSWECQRLYGRALLAAGQREAGLGALTTALSVAPATVATILERELAAAG